MVVENVHFAQRLHDSSINDALIDDRSAFLNNSELKESNQHHNRSVAQGQRHSASTKRLSSQERVGTGRVQRPRSSKGYRATQANGSHNASIGAPGTSNLSTAQVTATKFHSTKSEERQLKTSQHPRAILKQQQRKSAQPGGHAAANFASQTSSGFNREPMISQQNFMTKQKMGGVINSKSTSQLPQHNQNKVTKKQLQQLMA